MSRMRSFDSAILAVLGVLIAHQVAYLSSSAVGYETSVAHGHMKVAWLLASGGLLAALSHSVISSLRRRRHDGGSVLHLAAAIGGGYFILEQFERALDGYGAFDLFSEPVFWFGLAAAPLVALLLSWMLGSIEDAVARLVEGRTAPRVTATTRPCSLAITSLSLPSTSPLSFAVCRRGPPLGRRFS